MSEEATERAKALQKGAAKAELRLIERAQRAERKLGKARKRLVDAESRLVRAEDRLRRRQEMLQTAEVAVRDAQAARAVGPSASARSAATNGLASNHAAPPEPRAAFPERPTAAATATAAPTAQRAG